MANTYCENKSNKPVITRYDPSKNYVVQMVESLASIDYPNENHIYVIESTGDKYIFYNGAFSKFASTPLEPLILEYSATYTSVNKDAYQFLYSDTVTFSETFDTVKQAVEEGRPIYLKSDDGHIRRMNVESSESYIWFSSAFASRYLDNTQFESENMVITMPRATPTGRSVIVIIHAHNLEPDSALSSTSTRPVQNRVVKQAIDAISTLTNPLMVTVTTSNVISTGHNYYTVWSTTDITFSKLYSEIKNAMTNGIPIVVTYGGLTRICSAVEIDANTIALTALDAFLDNVPKPQYRTETFTIKSDNTGSYVKTLLSVNEVVTFTYGEPSTADMDFSKAVALHNSGNLLTAVVSMNGMTAVSKSYIYNGSIFIFALNVGMVSGTVQWSANSVVITINQ